MNTETAATPAEPTATPAPETQEAAPVQQEATTPAGDVETAPAGEGDASLDDLAGIEASADPEFVEVEVDGRKIRVSSDGKDYLLREADYRRKTMDLSEQRKAVEAERAKIAEQAKLGQEEFQAAVQLQALNDQIAQFEAVDWDAWTDSDPFEAQKAWQRYQTTLNRRNQVGGLLAQHMQQKEQRAQQESATRREAILSTAAKEIPNWSDDLRGQLDSFAKSHGYDPAVIDDVRDYKMLRLAHIGQQFIERQRKASAMQKASAAKSAPQVGSNAGAGSLDPSAMSMAEYIAARQAGKI